MKNFVLKFLVLSIAFGLTCCKPDDEPTYLGEFRLGEEGESYIKFEPGSYWIYENDMTQELDTIVMDYYYSTMRKFEGLKREYYREDISFGWRTGATGAYVFRSLHPFADLTPEESFQSSVRHWSIPGGGLSGSKTAMMHMPPKFNAGGGSGQISQLAALHDSLLVKDTWYYDVAEFEVDIDPAWKGRPTKYFWAKHVGLIKREQYEHWTEAYTQGWHLIEYNVN